MSDANPFIQFLRYDPITGRIIGMVTMSKPEDKTNYPDRIEAGQFGFTPSDIRSDIMLTHRLDDPSGTPTKASKARVTVSTDKTTINIDGIDEATVTFTGLVSDVNLEIAGQPVTITVADPELKITSLRPQRFRIFVNDLSHHSNTVIIAAV
jgi:hypothetical protein